MRTTLTLDDDVLQIAKGIAQARSVSLGAAVSELARRGFQREYTLQEEDGFPVFSVPAGAAPITLEDIKQMDDEF